MTQIDLAIIDERKDMKKKGLNLSNALYKEKSKEIKRNIRKDKKDYIEA